MKNFINHQELQDAISGRVNIHNTQCISELKEKYGHEPIAFWHFRQFAEICDYLLQNDINELSIDAKERLTSFFSTFIEKNPL